LQEEDGFLSINVTSATLVMFSAKFETFAYNFSTCQDVSLIEGKQPAATRSVTPNSLISEQLPHVFFFDELIYPFGFGPHKFQHNERYVLIKQNAEEEQRMLRKDK